MKVAFYIENKNIDGSVFRELKKGNPGIGGTPYLILLISSLLSSRNNGIEVVLFAQKKIIVEDCLEATVVSNAREAIFAADDFHCSYIVINLTSLNWVSFDYHNLQSNLKLIPWCHNFFGRYKEMNVFSYNDRIFKVVTVGKEQLDLYRDDLIFEKSDYIFNPVPLDYSILKKTNEIPFEKRRHVVTYMGSLLPGKSFHVLAKIWKQVIRSVPDAELYVIGTGSLYSSSSKLGKLGLASEEYENLFVSYLKDDDGNIMKNVHFMGKMGLEKYELLSKTKVGIPNPAGYGETFCITAVEMQAAGCVVTAMKAPGYFDTFINGNVVCNEKQLIQSIIQLLLQDTPLKSPKLVIETIEKKFSLDNIIQDWEKLFVIESNQHLHPVFPVDNRTYRAKKVKLIMGKIKKNSLFLKWIPSIERTILFFSQVLKKLFNHNLNRTI